MKKILLPLLCAPILAIAQPGTFDTSFAGTGKKSLYVQEQMTRAYRIAALPDGAVLTAGLNYSQDYSGAFLGAFVNKHLENGDADTSFGDNGIVYFGNPAELNCFITGLKIQPDGKIIVSGSINGQGEVRRLNANGSHDVNFGSNGVVSPGLQYISCMAIAPNGKIVAAGQYWNGFINVYQVHRYNSDGTPDTTFGNNGMVHADVTGYKFDLALDVLVQPDNKIVIAGESYFDIKNAVVSRFNEDGSPDITFADGGVAIVPLSSDGGNGSFQEIALQPDGKLVVAGYAIGLTGTGGLNSNSPAVVRLNANGIPDSTFGTFGKVILPTVYSANDQFTSLHLQSNGKILAGGNASYPYPYIRTSYYLTRFTSNGETDTVFGENGRLLLDFTNSDGDYLNYLQDITQTEDGRIFTAGFTGLSSIEEMKMIICRFKNDDTADINGSELPAFMVYPNPVTEVVNIPLPVGSCATQVYNMQGQVVFSQPREDFSGNISLSGLAAGSYILSVVSDSGTASQKIVKL
ncbi:T9SS type A sorting domain-containing protein [Flavobacterium sp.]|uniref:T9SS type A sorting domain-containing protein n=1 Tax=Flavobacterium sp. TaxID=239 RepID=UPI004033A9D1